MATEQQTTLTLDTLIVVRELFDGTELCFPVADPALVSYSPADAGLAEQRLFLEEYLPQQTPAVLARFSCPPATELRELDVLLERKDLPKRLQLSAPTSVACLVIPHGRDSWVVVPSIGHVFYVAPAEDLDQAVRDEVQRMVAAMEPTPLEFLELLPARSSRLEPLALELDRSKLAGFMPAGKARALRKRAAEAKLNRDALAVLESVAIPLHTRRSVLRAAPVVGRERELEQLDALLGAKERLSVLLLGDDLVGKSALFSAWLRARAGSDEPRPAYATSGAQLIAGMSGLGQWQERVRRVLEAAERLDAILYFDNLGDLFGDRPDGKVDLAGAMRPFVDDGRVRVVGELRQAAVESYERRHVGFFAGLHRIKLEPLSAAQAAEALQRRVEHAAQHEPQRPNLDPAAVQPLIDLVERYRPYQSHPGSGIALYEELRAMHEQAQRRAASRRSAPMEDKPATIGRDALLSAFSMQSGVPRFLLARDSALAVEEVQSRLARRLVGQREAVRRVAEAICVVKAGLQPPGKPLSTFLFVGPTGVGKTELARSLADYLFGSERRLTRFDMSEYMDAGAAQRLIQGTDRAEGQLTQRVRQQPFCVLLLDEIEKAHPAVFDLLLQVCGEGRLTDAAGRLAHFNNALIIMTSNLGAAHRRQAIGLAAPARDDQAYYDEQVEAAFRPEFVNRIDRIIAFTALSADEIEQIAGLALRGLNRRRGVSELGLSVEPSAAAVCALALRGHSEAYGARQLRRALEQSLVTPLARLLADLGPRARGARALVQTAAEAEADPAGSELLAQVSIPAAADEDEEGEHEALVVTVSRQQRGAPRSSAQLRGLNDLSELRRRVDRYMELETVSEVRDQLDFIVAQLTAGGDGKGEGKGKGGKQPPGIPADRDGRRAREITELQSEHHRLVRLWEPMQRARAGLETIEELCLTALFEDEDPAPYLEESAAGYQQLLHNLFYLLVARRRHRDGATLLVQELEGRPLDRWLGALLEACEARSWSVALHGDGDKPDRKVTAEADWPGDRRWGPPRDAAWARELLARQDRPRTSLLLRCSGPYAGAALGLEAGLHRYERLGQGDKPATQFVTLVAQRTQLSDLEWLDDRLLPHTPAGFGTLRRLAPLRLYPAPGGPCRLLGGERQAEVPLCDYWARFEEIGALHLLCYEEHDTREIDGAYLPLLPNLRASDGKPARQRRRR